MNNENTPSEVHLGEATRMSAWQSELEYKTHTDFFTISASARVILSSHLDKMRKAGDTRQLAAAIDRVDLAVRRLEGVLDMIQAGVIPTDEDIEKM